MRLIKFLLASLMGLIVLLTVFVVVLTKVIDPNDFKPELEGLAAGLGFPLQLQGNIGWQWYPYLGLSLDGVIVGDEPLLAAQHLAARVELKPLLQRRLVIRALEVSGVQLNLSRNQTGAGNWQALGADQKQPLRQSEKASDAALASVVTDETNTTAPMVIAVDEISLSDISIIYTDLASDTVVDVRELQLTLADFDMAGRTFKWQSSGWLRLNSQPPVKLSGQGESSFDYQRQRLSMASLELSLETEQGTNKDTIAVKAYGQLDFKTAAAELAVELKAFALRHWLQAFAVELPPMAAADALSKLTLTAAVSVSEQGWGLKDLNLVLDQSQVSGEVRAAEDGQLSARLMLNQLNLDRYLSGAEAGSEPKVKGEPALQTSAETLDLSPVRTINGELSLSIKALQGYGLQFNDAVVELEATAGVVSLRQFQAGFYQGTVSIKGSLDARADEARVRAEGKLQDVALKPVLQILADEDQLAGVVSGDWKLTAAGDRFSSLQNSLSVSAQVNARQITLAGVDVERTACELAALVNSKPVPNLPWKGATTLRDVSVSTAMLRDKLTVKQLQAGVENIGLVARGELNLSSGEFDIPASVAFVGAVDETRKCQVRERWRNRPLPIICRGEMASLSARTCLPDRKRLDDLLRDELKDRAGEKVKEKLQEKLGGDGSGAVEDLFRGLLRR